MKLAAILAIFALSIIAAIGWEKPSALAGPNCDVDAGIDGEEQEFLRLINDYRGQHRLEPLALSDTLNHAAAWKSQHMAAEGYFAHDDTPIGRTWVERLRDCGYTHNTWLGENILAASETAADAFERWRNSPAHNGNMLSSNYTAIGIGRAYGGPHGWYWTTDFGGVADGYSLPPASYPCADFTGDGKVMISDILFVVDRFQTADALADMDHNGTVSVNDILIVVAQYFSDCSA